MADALSVNWVQVISGSAVAAVIAACVTLWIKKRDHQRDDDAKAERQAQARFDVAIALEKFVSCADRYLTNIDMALESYHQGDLSALDYLNNARLDFSLTLEPIWADLGLERSDEVHELLSALRANAAWIAGQRWAVRHEIYEFQMQRAMFFGVEAHSIASRIRSDIKLAASATAAECHSHFERQFQRLGEQYVDSRGTQNIIPEWKPRIDREYPVEIGTPTEGGL